jgi:branched-chain amino acid transport system ATP-binding protein
MLLELEGVSRSFGAVAAVNNLSFSIAEGEVLGIMGPNGAGKTTLLNLIMGAVPLDKGTISFAGERINGLSVSSICHRGIGRTYQIPQPFRNMTVLENLLVGELYGGKRHTMKTAREQALAVLERVGLGAKSKAQAGALGLLELKRLELARALSLHPRLLLLDEIAGGLVESEVEQLKELLFELKRAGQSMLIIEHLLSVLFGLSDRIVVLNFGECIATGTPATVIHNPVVVEAYLGKEHAGETMPPLEELHESLTLGEDAANDVAQLEEKSEEQAATIEETADTQNEGALLLHMSQVSAGYGEFQALFDVSLHIQKGEIVALIGLNGAGKTTLIRTLTRRLPLKAGDILFRGKSLTGVPAHDIADLGIAQCLEGRKIFPELTVLENLELGAYCKHARQQRRETLRQVYDLFPILAERRDQLGSTLSGGQQQMLAIGRALMAKPELIIFDEVSLGLAPIIIDELYRAIVEINRQGMTILLVEQSVQRSLDIVQRAYVMEHGRMVLSGTAQSLKNNTDFRQAYFGL